MRQTITLTLLLLTTLALSSCGKEESVAGSSSCTVVNGGFTTCFDYTGAGYTTTTAQSACAATSAGGATGTYAAAACTATGRIGSCKLNSGQLTEQYVRYYTGYNTTTAGTACTGLSGTFTAG